MSFGNDRHSYRGAAGRESWHAVLYMWTFFRLSCGTFTATLMELDAAESARGEVAIRQITRAVRKRLAALGFMGLVQQAKGFARSLGSIRNTERGINPFQVLFYRLLAHLQDHGRLIV